MPGAPPRSREAPAARQAIRDLDALAPMRSRASDGIMGDARHQARPSDHNRGNAVDLTHDPAGGVEGGALAALALTDPRTSYVIWDGQIANPAIDGGRWRPYGGPGKDPHRHHVHISIREGARDNVAPWPWSPSFNPYV